MEQNEKANNEEEKQNLEEEEFDEEDEEEKEQEKEEADNKKEENVNKKEKVEDNKVENINTNPIIENINQSKDEKNQNEEKIDLEKKEEKIEDINEKEENNENVEAKENLEKKEENKEEEKDIKENKHEEEIKKDNLEERNLPEKSKDFEVDKEEIENKEEKNIPSDKKDNESLEKEEEFEEQKESTRAYILKYSRKNNEPRESAYDKELIKSKHCLFMIEFKILKRKNEKFLLIYCHEIAAIYFDEIYEKKYSIKDLYNENRHFRIFDDIEEAKNIVDEIINNNQNNPKKIFIDLQENTFRLHLKIVFFDKENEVIFNVPKKNIDDKERIRLLPEFLKEIQIKMNHLEGENKKLKTENKLMNESELMGSGNKANMSGEGENDFFFDTKNETTSSNTKKNKSGNGKGYKKKLIKK